MKTLLSQISNDEQYKQILSSAKTEEEKRSLQTAIEQASKEFNDLFEVLSTLPDKLLEAK